MLTHSRRHTRRHRGPVLVSHGAPLGPQDRSSIPFRLRSPLPVTPLAPVTSVARPPSAPRPSLGAPRQPRVAPVAVANDPTIALHPLGSRRHNQDIPVIEPQLAALKRERAIATEQHRANREGIHALQKHMTKVQENISTHPVFKNHRGKMKLVELGRSALHDPFDNYPPCLGFGKYYPTSHGTAYIKGNFNLNADGSGYVMVNPNVNNFYLTNNLAGGSTTTALFSPCQNSVADLASLTSARPLAMSLRTWTDESLNGTVGVAYAGQLRYDMASLGSYGAPSTFTGAGSTTNPFASAGPYCIAFATEKLIGGTSTTTGSYLLPGYSTTNLTTLPNNHEQLASDPMQVNWLPEDQNDVEFNPGFAGDTTTVEIIPPVNYPNTDVLSNIGGGTVGNTTVVPGVFVYPGAVLYAAFSGLPANTPIYFEAIYHYEYTSDGRQGPANAPSSVADVYPTAENYYRDVMKAPTPPEPVVHHKSEPSFFDKVGKVVSDVMESPFFDLLVSGATALFGATPDLPHTVYRRGNIYLLRTLSGVRTMSTAEVEAYFREQGALAATLPPSGSSSTVHAPVGGVVKVLPIDDFSDFDEETPDDPARATTHAKPVLPPARLLPTLARTMKR